MSAILLLMAALVVVNGQEKAPCKVDLVFLVDGSSSICEDDPACQNWKVTREFIKNIVRYLTIGPDESRVAYLKYGNQTDLRFNLIKYKTEASVLAAIDAEEIPGGELTSADSFTVVVTDVFNTTVGDRPDVCNVAIIITDNAEVFRNEAKEKSAELQKDGRMKMMMVCLNTTTSTCWESTAVAVSSPPHENGKTYFMAETYSVIDSVRKTLEGQICEFCDP